MTPDQTCPACGGQLSTYKTKPVAGSPLVRRYRKCGNATCHYRERIIIRPAVILQRKELG
jgi:hypothetical protein